MPACTWRQPGTCESVGVSLYCRGLEEGHPGPHREEVLSPSNVHADVLRAFVERMAVDEGSAWVEARLALYDANHAAQAVREGRY